MIRIIKDLNVEAIGIGDPEKIGEGPYKSEEEAGWAEGQLRYQSPGPIS
jgi:hypothetical protein